MHWTIFNSDLKCQFSVCNKKLMMPVLAIFSQFSLFHLLIILFHLSTKCKKSLIQPSPVDTTFFPVTATVIPSTNLLRWITRRILPSTCVANFSAGALVIPHHLMRYLLVRPGLCICFTTSILLYLHHQLHINFLSFQRMPGFTTLSRNLPIVQIPSWCAFNTFTARAYLCLCALTEVRNKFF